MTARDQGGTQGEAVLRAMAHLRSTNPSPSTEGREGEEEGATTVRRFIDNLPNDRFTQREIERLREWADEVGA
jgi:hypothetical protein